MAIENDNHEEERLDAIWSAMPGKAKELAQEHDIDVRRVYSVLKSMPSCRLYEHYLPGRPTRYEVSWPHLEEALRYLPAERALTLFESEAEGLIKRAAFFHRIASYQTPMYDLDELGQLTGALIALLYRNREDLVNNGLPGVMFARCWWLCQHLNRIYYMFNGSPRGRHRYGDELDWILRRNPWTDAEDMVLDPDISTPHIDEFTVDQLARIESSRGQLFDLRMSILDFLLRAVQDRSGERIWWECSGELAETFGPDEVEAFTGIDQSYAANDLHGHAPVNAYRFTGGGLTDLLLVIGHYDQEITVGTLAKTRGTLRQLVTLDSKGRRSLPVRSYFEAMDRPEQAIFDRAFEIFESLAPDEQAWWGYYQKQVDQFLRKPLYCEKQQRSVVDQFEPHARTYCNWVRSRLEGGAISLSPPGLEHVVPPGEGRFRYSPDFCTVWLRGDIFTLTPRQAAVVRVLYEAFKNGTPELSHAYILEEIGSTSRRLRDVFKSSTGAWKRLIRSGEKKGIVRLNL